MFIVLLSPDVNPIVVNKCINYQLRTEESESVQEVSQSMFEMEVRRVVA